MVTLKMAADLEYSSLMENKTWELYTVYCKSFEVEKFHGFRGLIGDRETFPAKLFRSREYHS